ncbi:MAG: coenzyme F420-0:L-glutamate ligase [Candidatus Paceibacteria bacterium]
MQILPIRTKILHPPQDDLLVAIEDSISEIKNGDVILISSKVVAIHEGCCIPEAESDKSKLINSEADIVIETEYRAWPLTVTRHTFLGASGIDESNGNGYLVLLPEDCFASAKYLHEFFITTYKVDDIGIIITDSRSSPFRYGATGVALAWWGIEPLENHIGKPDLFGREFKYERSNIVDGLAAGAAVVGGETDECTPIVIARDVPNLSFTLADTRNHLLAPFADDTFRVLYEKWL